MAPYACTAGVENVRHGGWSAKLRMPVDAFEWLFVADFETEHRSTREHRRSADNVPGQPCACRPKANLSSFNLFMFTSSPTMQERVRFEGPLIDFRKYL